MDPLSLSAGIIAVLQLSGTLVSYLNSVQSATKDQAYLAVEVSNLYSLLTALKYRVEEAFASDPIPKDPWFTAVSILGTEDGPLDQTEKALERLANRIEPVRGVKKVVRQLLWKLEQAECLDILSKIERLKSLINLALTNDLFSLPQAIKHDISDIGAELAALRLGHQEEEIASIQSWLSPLDFRSRQQEIFRGRQEGTRQWLFESYEFQSWVSAPGGTLWCPGIPGAGKTVTSSIIFDYLRRDSQRQNASVACLFCNYRDRADQSAETFMANLLKQVIQDQPNLSEDVKRIYLCHRPKRPTFAETAEAFRNEIKRFSKVFVIIDALDETTDNDDIRTLLLSELESLPIHLLVTSRHDTIIERRFDHAQCLEIRATDGDVQTYVKARIATEKILLRHIERNPSLEERILKTVVDKSKKM